MAALAVVLVSVAVRLVCPAAPDDPPVKLDPAGADQAYVVPAGNTVPVGEYVNAMLVQVLVLWAVIVACGSTDTVTVKAVPVHVPELGVTL